nr:MAG TPA: hypothetical protein [Caudoviricetes sp.]
MHVVRCGRIRARGIFWSLSPTHLKRKGCLCWKGK